MELPATDLTMTAAPAKRKRKPRKAAPPATDKPPRKPSRTLAAIVREMGAAHVEALRILSKADPHFKADLRGDLSRDVRIASARAALQRADAAVERAKATVVETASWGPATRLAALNDLASKIAVATAKAATDVQP